MGRVKLVPGKRRLVTTEKNGLENILLEFFDESKSQEELLTQGYEILKSISEEIKSIQNQAILLHGERIKKAHTILCRYRTGAFHAWMMATYGNRQTPYSLLQYYEFYQEIPSPILREKLERIPRKAAYIIASRQVPIEKKIEFLEKLDENKRQTILMLEIRDTFQGDKEDARTRNVDQSLLLDLKKRADLIEQRRENLSPEMKEEILKLAEKLTEMAKQ